MKTINVICPFNPVTRQTILPEGVDWVHLTPEQGNTVVVQVRGEDAVIEAMKADPAYQFLEEIIPPAEPVANPELIAAKDALNQAWVDEFGEPRPPAEVIPAEPFIPLEGGLAEEDISVLVESHGLTMEAYRGSGLGDKSGQDTL